MERNDTHRPSEIIPADYEFVAHEFLKVEDLGDAYFLAAERATIQRHMARTGGTYSRHEHGGNCMVCGSVNAIYTILFYHAKTNTYIRMGSDCARKCEMGGDFDNSAFRQHIADARLAIAGKRKAQAILGDLGLTKAWDLWVAGEPPCTCGWSTYHTTGEAPAYPCKCPRFRYEERTIYDIVARLVTWGSISERQSELVGKLLIQIDRRAEIEAQRAAETAAAAPCPTGRVTIEGIILSTKEQESDYGVVTKMLVRHDTGYKVWGTRPGSLENARGLLVGKGDRVRFSATVTPSKDDPKFGFYSRPTKSECLATAPEASNV